MPLYEYECDANHHRFEVIRKFSDPPLETCPTCGSTIHKLISSPAFQFKGSGWYITDYAKKDGAASEKPAASKDGGSSESTTTPTSSSDAKAAPATPAASPAKSE